MRWDDIRWTDNAIGSGKATCSLPHSHHIVGNITLANEQVLVGTKCRFSAAIQFITKDQTVLHRYRQDRQVLPSGLLPICEKIAQM